MKKILLLTIAVLPVSLLALTWHDASSEPFTIYAQISGAPGFQRVIPSVEGWSESPERHYTQLEMGRCSAGLQLRFRTDSDVIRIKTELESPGSTMFHMTAACQSGMDLYKGTPGNEIFCGTIVVPLQESGYDGVIYQTGGRIMTDYVIYLPLYNSVRQFHIGLDDDAVIEEAEPFPDGSIVFFGTSITQGGCASRPGMCHTNILSRMLGREVYNFGYSGSGTLEKAQADMMLHVPDPALFVIESENNNSYASTEAKLKNFIMTLRNARPDVPVLVISALRGDDAHADLHQKIVKECGDMVYFIRGNTLLPGDPGEYTVDLVHFNSYGFQAYAEAILPAIQELISQ